MLAARIAFASIAVLVLAALWYAFRPHAAVIATPAVTAISKAPMEKAFELVVKDGKRVSGPAALQVREGERVRLTISSNANDELHLHGYDLKLRIKAGEPATLEFAAARSGRFELELHKRHTELGALEVYPK
jgi:FtsP/CotA-like multicopper oxidase with cupredoxin domain